MVVPLALDASPGASEWKKMKVQELRDELASRGMDTTGLKAALIERLEASVPRDEIGNAADDGDRKDMDLDVSDVAPADKSEKQVPEQSIPMEASVDGVEVKLEVGSKVEPVGEVVQRAEPVTEDSVGPVVPVELPAQETINGNAVAISTDLEKKQRRAERFGLELMVSEVEKRRLRAARFGDTLVSKTNGSAKTSQEEASKMSLTVKDAEAIKRKARAARFGIEEVHGSPALKADEVKKKARLARFGLEVKVDPLELEKKKIRAARFGLAAEAKPVDEANEQPVGT